MFKEKSLKRSVAINLDGVDSTDEDGNIVLYEWNFGDNSSIQTGQKVSYTYKIQETYTILLTVTDNSGNKSESLRNSLSKRHLQAHKTDGEDCDRSSDRIREYSVHCEI